MIKILNSRTCPRVQESLVSFTLYCAGPCEAIDEWSPSRLKFESYGLCSVLGQVYSVFHFVAPRAACTVFDLHVQGQLSEARPARVQGLDSFGKAV